MKNVNLSDIAIDFCKSVCGRSFVKHADGECVKSIAYNHNIAHGAYYTITAR